MSDKLLKDIASRYVEQYGEELQREVEHAPHWDTAELDKRIAQEREQYDSAEQKPVLDIDSAKKSRVGHSRRTWGVLVAACLVLLLVLPSALHMLSPRSDTAEQYEPLELNFTLSKHFSIARTEQDRGQTIYYLDNTLRDDVVLTMEREEDAQDTDYSQLRELEINGKAVLGSYQADYSILTFAHEGIRYTLTCQHDFNTLAELGESILS